MFRIQGNDIFISRGEHATFTVTPYESDGTAYAMDAGDRLRMTIRAGNGGGTVKTKYTDAGATRFTFASADTADMGGKYDYRVDLLYAAADPVSVVGESPAFTPHFIVLEG